MREKCPYHSIENIEEFDALNQEARANPYPFYDWLRAAQNRRVYSLPHEKNFFVLHHYEDVKRAFSEEAIFSSQIIPTAKNLFFVLMNGAEHKRIRQVITRIFTPQNIEKKKATIEQIIHNISDDFIANQAGDLLKNWAIPIPLAVLASILGFSTQKSTLLQLEKATYAINQAIFVVGGTGPRRSSQPNWKEKFFISCAILKNSNKILTISRLLKKNGIKELLKMLSIVDKEMNVPRPSFEHLPASIAPILDLMIAMAKKLKAKDSSAENLTISTLKAAIQSKEITLMEAVMAGVFMLFAGHETTTSLLSNCFVHLAENPKDWSHLKEHPEDIDKFIEEALRLYTPVGRFLRRTTQQVQIGETLIPAQALILVLAGGANTDAKKFENGCQFNPNRKGVKQHLSFGKGAHFCIGAQVARLTVKVALSHLLKNTNYLALDKSKPFSMVTDRDNGVFRYDELWVNLIS